MNTTPVEPSQPKVYLIDDDPVSTFLLVDLVESIGLPYAVFENAVKFLERDLEGLEGCIVSDLRMPFIRETLIYSPAAYMHMGEFGLYRA